MFYLVYAVGVVEVFFLVHFFVCVYLLGMVSGLQAMTNDINSGGAVNVPKDIAGIVERGMACLDNEKFWGAPMATRAVIWTLLPGAGDGKPEPYATMKESMQIGEKKGVRVLR